ncbi:DNA-directed RNA polymerase subunit beta [Candidatus Vidania fulgoroideorum]
MNYSVLLSKGFENKLIIKSLLYYHKNSYSNIFNKNSIFSINNLLENTFPVSSKKKELTVKYVSYEIKKPELSFIKCKKNSISYCYKLYILLSFYKYKKKIFKKRYFFCDLPAMTNNCSFLINGIERTIVSKISKSPGVYFCINKQNLREVNIIPLWGNKLKILINSNGKINVFFKKKTFSINILIKHYGIKYKSIFNQKTLYSLINIKNKKTYISYINNICFLKEISKKKLLDMKLYEDFYKYKKNTFVKKELIKYAIENNKSFKVLNIIFRKEKYNRNVVKEFKELEDIKKFNLSIIGRKIINKKIFLINNKNIFLDRNTIYTIIKRLVNDDFISSISYDIDDIKYKKIMCCGEIIIKSMLIGIKSSIRLIKDKLKFIKKKKYYFINFNSVNNSIKDFFCSSNLSQFLEQTNILSEITHKRRISFMSNSNRNVPKNLRDVNNSFYGKICPIETPEGANIGLVNSLTIFCLVDKLGFFLSPYIYKKKKIKYLYSYEEENKVFSNLKKYNFSNINYLFAKKNNLYYITVDKFVEYYDFSSIQIFSIASSTIPFLDKNDANRALMGANMQRQAIPCLKTSYPYIITGTEKSIFNNIRPQISISGKLIFKDLKNLVFETKKKIKILRITRNVRTNQNTIIRKKCILQIGEKIKKNKKIFKYLCNKNNILSLGRNLTVAFIPWKGYNYEDSIIISEKVIRKDYFTSLHSEQYEVLLKENNIECGKVTNLIPNISKKKIKKLYKNGIVKLGSIVNEGDILIGRVILNKNNTISSEEKLINAIKNNKNPNLIDYSFRVPKGVNGVVSEINLAKKKNKKIYIEKVCKKNIFNTIKKLNKNKFENLKNVIKILITISYRKRLMIGDKMSGRYGNKGVIAKIIPEHDMPFMNDGTPCEIILNPLSIPSRMNIGQLIELKYGFLIILLKKYIKYYFNNNKKIKKLMFIIYNKYFKINIKKFYKRINICSIPFREDNNKYNTIMNYIMSDKLFLNFKFKNNKLRIRNGINGYEFIKSISVGTLYYMKLYHTVDSKIHARSVGPYSLITQQPLKGKSQFGGQRLGEMEVWALEAYGASHILFEMLTLKSDDIKGRKKMYENTIKNNKKTISKSSESLKILIREIRSLGIEVIIK